MRPNRRVGDPMTRPTPTLKIGDAFEYGSRHFVPASRLTLVEEQR